MSLLAMIIDIDIKYIYISMVMIPNVRNFLTGGPTSPLSPLRPFFPSSPGGPGGPTGPVQPPVCQFIKLHCNFNSQYNRWWVTDEIARDACFKATKVTCETPMINKTHSVKIFIYSHPPNWTFHDENEIKIWTYIVADDVRQKEQRTLANND